MVAQGGFEALDGLSDEAKRYIAPLPLNYLPNKSVDEYFRAMKMPEDETERRRNLLKAPGGQRRYDGLVDRRTDAVRNSST